MHRNTQPKDFSSTNLASISPENDKEMENLCSALRGLGLEASVAMTIATELGHQHLFKTNDPIRNAKYMAYFVSQVLNQSKPLTNLNDGRPAYQNSAQRW